MRWSRAELEAKGFGGWITFETLRGQLAEVTSAGGVYVVVQAVGSEAEFRDTNPGGRFKDQDPTVDAAALPANWVDGAEVVYVGKADNLRRAPKRVRCASVPASRSAIGAVA